jgi:uncharacterized protein YndB with AHSA1/START domain
VSSIHPTAAFARDGSFVSGALMVELAAAPDTVWRALVEPARLADWLAPGRIEPRAGGAVRLDFEGSGTVIESEVAALEAGRLVAFSWSKPGEPARPVRLQLEPAAGGSRLTVTVKTPLGEDPARACAGWAAHLAMLAAALDGAPIAFPFETFKAAREEYRALMAAF